MSQLNVNVVAPLGYTGPNLPGDSNFVEIIDKNGNTAMEITETEVTVANSLKVNNILPQSAGIVDINGVTIERANGSVYLGNSSNIPNTLNSVIIGEGAAPSLTGQANVAIGKSAMLNATTGFSNVALGAGAGQSLTTGLANVLIGSTAGINISTGPANVCVGQAAGANLTANSAQNTFIGNETGNGIANLTGFGNTCIGVNATPSSASAFLEFTLGSSVNVLRCQQTSITSLSDARDKKEITELSAGLDFVKTLKPVEFVWDDRDENGRHDIKDFGFIAQDLKKSQEDAELADTLKLVYESNPEKLEASYGKLIPILVKAIQDLSAKVEALEAQ